jgi:hypothetical protein
MMPAAWRRLEFFREAEEFQKNCRIALDLSWPFEVFTPPRLFSPTPNSKVRRCRHGPVTTADSFIAFRLSSPSAVFDVFTRPHCISEIETRKQHVPVH